MVKVKFTLEQATKAQRERERVDVYLYSSFSLGTRRGWVVNAMPWPLYPGKDPVPIA